MTRENLVKLLITASNPYKCLVETEPRFHRAWGGSPRDEEDELRSLGLGIIYDEKNGEARIIVYNCVCELRSQNRYRTEKSSISIPLDTEDSKSLEEITSFLEGHGFPLEVFLRELHKI